MEEDVIFDAETDDQLALDDVKDYSDETPELQSLVRYVTEKYQKAETLLIKD